MLGIAAGEVQVELGGPNGQTLNLAAGDVVVIPAGVAHRNVGHSGRLTVVGAYPGGADWDVKRGEPGEYDAVVKTAVAVSSGVTDPVSGGDGELRRLWADGAVVRR